MARITKITGLPFKEYFAGLLVFNLLVGVFVLAFQAGLPPVVPLLYGLPVGEEQLVPRLLLTIPSLIAIFLTGVNAIVAGLNDDPFIHKVLVGVSIALTLLSAITTIKIFFLVS